MFLGIDLSPDEVAVIVADAAGQARIALRSAHAPSADSPTRWTNALDVAREALRQSDLQPAQIRRAALAMEMPFNARGVIGRGALTDGWEGFDVPAALQTHLGMGEAVAASRSLCAALGEAKFGALRTIDNETSEYSEGANWLYIRLGARFGAAAQVNGTLLRGAGNNAMDLGAICLDRDGALGDNGARGSLEAYCGGESLVARAAGYGITVRQAREVWAMADQNYAARTLCDDFVRRLAQGIGIALHILDVRRVVLGGALADELGETLLTPLRIALTEFWRATPTTAAQATAAPPETVSTQGSANTQTAAVILHNGQLGRDATVLGAVALAMGKGAGN